MRKFISLLVLFFSLCIISSANAEFYWRYDMFKNEFEESTNQTYMYYLSEGTFSNTIASNESAFTKLIVSYDGTIGFFIYEYNYSTSPLFFSKGILKMKNSNGEILEVYDFLRWFRHGGLLLSENDSYAMFRFLRKSVGEVKIVIYDNNYSTYNFIVNANSFIKSTERLQRYHKLKN